VSLGPLSTRLDRTKVATANNTTLKTTKVISGPVVKPWVPHLTAFGEPRPDRG
jgi:hypothetical protein